MKKWIIIIMVTILAFCVFSINNKSTIYVWKEFVEKVQIFPYNENYK